MNLWWFLRWGRNVSHRNLIIYVRRLRKPGTQEEEKCRLLLVLTRQHQTSVTLTHWLQGIFWETFNCFTRSRRKQSRTKPFSSWSSSAAMSQGWQQRYAEWGGHKRTPFADWRSSDKDSCLQGRLLQRIGWVNFLFINCTFHTAACSLDVCIIKRHYVDVIIFSLG